MILGAVFQATVDQAVRDAIGKQVILSNGSAGTDQFIHTDAPLYINYFFFHITNADDVLNHGAIPRLQQKGPYAFRENRSAFDLEWMLNDTVLQYKTNITFEFDPEMSGAGLDPLTDVITTVNVPLIGLFTTVEKMQSELLDILMEALDDVKKAAKWDGVFADHTVSELLWGYTDPILHALNEGHHLFNFIPDENPVFAFANYSSVEEPNMVYTGVNDSSLVSKYIQWNNHTEMAWANHFAAMINGTGGFSFHPGITREERLEVFIDEIFRSGYFTYDSDILDHGIRLYKFMLPDDELLNSTQAAAGFPSNNPNGVMNMSAVVPGHVPLFASKPHFLHADPAFRENVTGMHPDPSIHDSFIGVEPMTGASMNAAKRIQLNLKLDRSTIFSELKHVPDTTMLPIYYAEQRGIITASLANEFKDKVFTIRYGIMGTMWAVVGLAGIVSVVSVMCLFGLLIQRCRGNHGKRDRHIQYESL